MTDEWKFISTSRFQKKISLFHYMGEPTETRHIIMRSEEAVISPSWSIHSASATHAYAFIWGMAGENQDFDDMDWCRHEGFKAISVQLHMVY